MRVSTNVPVSRAVSGRTQVFAFFFFILLLVCAPLAQANRFVDPAMQKLNRAWGDSYEWMRDNPNASYGQKQQAIRERVTGPQAEALNAAIRSGVLKVREIKEKYRIFTPKERLARGLVKAGANAKGGKSIPGKGAAAPVPQKTQAAPLPGQKLDGSRLDREVSF